MSSSSEITFIETKEYRRFDEFCQACSRYCYIGLCYGPPGVGKTLSARHYADWDNFASYNWMSSPVVLKGLLQHKVILYTPSVVNSAGQIERDISALRLNLREVLLEDIRRREEPRFQEAWKRETKTRKDFPSKSTCAEIVANYSKKRRHAKDPTILIVIDETDRLRMAGLEQVRDIFDQGGIGLVLIGMPGLEKRLARYPQLYSRVGFVHQFRPLAEAETRRILKQRWTPSGVTLPDNGLEDEEALAAILRITGGNFRLLDRLLTQIGRILEVNQLNEVTRQVVEAARESLVIGIAV